MQLGDRIRFAAGIFTLCLGAQLCSAEAVPPTELKALITKYEQCLAAIQTSIDKRLQEWPQAYAAELKKVERKLQTEGDLDGLLTVRKEMERFDREKVIPESATVTYPVVRELQLKWRKVPETADIDKSKRIVLLSLSHIAALEDLKKRLTVQGKVEEAIAARDELERVRTSAPVTAAEFILANAGVTLAPEASKEAKPAGGPSVAGVDANASAMAADLRSSLVLYYSFDRSDGAKVADKSGKGNDGKVHGAKWTPKGRAAGAYVFNGSNSRILIDNNASLDFGQGPRTIAAWIRSSGASQDNQAIFDKGTNPGYALRLGPSPDRVIEYFKSAGTSYSFFTSAHTITDDAWHHLVVVDRGNGTVEFYKDGALLETVTRTNYNSDSNSKAAIGALPTPSMAQVFNGIIDEVMIFKRAVTTEEVKQIWGPGIR